MNNATLGISIQKMICDTFKIELQEETINQFKANYVDLSGKDVSEVIKTIFKEINEE